MTKLQAIRILSSAGRDASFVGNVVLCHHRKPARRLVQLARLVQAGRDVRFAAYSMDCLLVDGAVTSWTALESGEVR